MKLNEPISGEQTMPPPGVDATASVGDEGPGQLVAYEANYRVGAPVVHELLNNGPKYRDTVPAGVER